MLFVEMAEEISEMNGWCLTIPSWHLYLLDMLLAVTAIGADEILPNTRLMVYTEGQ